MSGRRRRALIAAYTAAHGEPPSRTEHQTTAGGVTYRYSELRRLKKAHLAARRRVPIPAGMLAAAAARGKRSARRRLARGVN